MDRHKASWILEFVLRQPAEDWLAKDILRRLPIPTPLDPHLKKTVLLRCLSSDVCSGHLSDSTLKYLELLEELDRSLGAARALEELRAAYAAVAAELTAAPLRSGDRAHFLAAVSSIWNCRVADLERSEARGMMGQELRKWRRRMEEAAANDVTRELVLRQDTRGEAVEALRVYVTAALKGMGPTLLELAARAAGGKAGAGGGGGPHQRANEQKAATMPGASAERSAAAGVATMESAPMDHPAPLTGAEGTALLPEVDTLGEDRTSKVINFLPIREVNKVKKALKSSCADLQKAVEDPLPNALQRAVEIQNSLLDLDKSATHDAINRQNQTDLEDLATPHDANNAQNQMVLEKAATHHDAGSGQNLIDMSAPGPSIQNDAQAMVTERSTTQDHNRISHPPKPRSSLMDRNPTACSNEWNEDSIEAPSDNSPNSSVRLCLPTPRNQRASPLQIQEIKKIVKRRKIKRWTPQEEDVLRDAVKRHGRGNWKVILQSYPGAFEDRTEVDLKDKWRNLTR